MTTPSTPSDTASLSTSIFSLPPKNLTEAEQRLARSAHWRFSTLCASVDTKDQYGASATPIYQTATFKGMDGKYDYTRSGNPTRGGLGAETCQVRKRSSDLWQNPISLGCMAPPKPSLFPRA